MRSNFKGPYDLAEMLHEGLSRPAREVKPWVYPMVGRKMPHFHALLIAVSTAAMGPTLAMAGLLTYLQSSLGFQINPEYIIAAILLIFVASVWVLKREAQRVFGLIDTIPQLGVDVASIKRSVEAIVETSHDFATWRTNIEVRMALIEHKNKGEKS